MDQVVSLIESLDAWLSVASFFVALWAGITVRNLRSGFHDLIRGQDLLDDLRATASEISNAAVDPVANKDALLLSFVSAETTLEGLQERVGGRFVFWGTRGALKSDIGKLRRSLKRYQEEDNHPLDREAVMTGEYLEIQRVVFRAENLLRDRRLER